VIFSLFVDNEFIIEMPFPSAVCHSKHRTHDNHRHVPQAVSQRSSSKLSYDWRLCGLLLIGLALVYSGNSFMS